MKFPELDLPDATQLLYFDSWEADRLLRLTYYSGILLVWFSAVVLTVWSAANYAYAGLLVGVVLSLALMCTGVLCVRLVLEGCLSVFMIRDAVVRAGELRQTDTFEEEEEEEESEALEEGSEEASSLSSASP